MADTKISALTTLADASLASGDYFPVVDVSDTSMAASGTTKKLAASAIMAVAGTWTPTSSDVTMQNGTAGYYTKIGRIIFCQARLVFPASASSTTMAVSLPFTPLSLGGITSQMYGGTTTRGVAGVPYVNGTSMSILKADLSAAYTYTDVSNMDVRIAMWFLT